MKAKPLTIIEDEYVQCNAADAKFLEIRVPGNNVRRIIPIVLHEPDEEEIGPVWVWNGDARKPTLHPDIDTQHPKTGRCRIKVTDGRVEFMLDSTHENAGKTMDLLDIE